MPALTHKLEAINDDPTWAAVAKKIESPEWQAVDVPTFAQKSEAHRKFAGKAVASAADLKLWMTEVDGYGSQLASATMRPDGGAAKPVVVEPRPSSSATMAAATPATKPTVLADATTKPAPPPATMASSTRTSPQSSSPTTMASAAVSRPNPTTKETVKPPTPTTLASAASSPTRIETYKPPTTVAVVVPPAPPPPDPEKLRVERERQQREKEIAAFVAECREVAIKASNRDIKDAWRTANGDIADRVEKDHALYMPGVKSQRDKLRARLLQLDSAYTSAVAPLSLKPPASVWGAPLVKALQGAAPTRADELKELIALATAGDARFESTLRELDDLDTQWRGAAAHVVADAVRVEHLLNVGYMPGVKSPDTAPLALALNSLRSGELYKNADVQQSLEPLLRPVSVVESESNAPSAMRLLAEAADQPLGVRLAAWFKSGKDVSREALGQDLKSGEALLTAARAKVTDKSRVDAIKGRLEADLRTRWEALLAGAKREQDVAAAIAMRDKITGVEIDKLAPAARFNFALHDLRQAVADAKGDDALEALAPAVQKVKALAASLTAEQRSQPAVAGLIGEVDRLGQGAQADLTTLGPASEAAKASANKIVWSPSVDPAGDKVAYRAVLATDAGKEDVTLVFRRVRPSASGPASWICTTETSVGFFADLVTAADRWSAFHKDKLLPEYESSHADPRVGPRAWDWTPYGRGMTRTLVWLSRDFVPPRAAHYPAGIAAEFNPTQIGNPSNGERSEELNPSRRQPMQYVSAKAAMLAASLIGCRLPTAAEWQTANKGVERHMGVNLRDVTWRLELDHMKRTMAAGRCRPDAGMFVPAGEKPSDEVWQRGDGGELNDGVLWFREVPVSPRPPEVFVDLVGNVGEFVTDSSGKVCVIGGSALSPPTRPTDKPFPIAADQATTGFSDVGFRLAFSEPAPGIDKLRDLVAGNWYLTAQ